MVDRIALRMVLPPGWSSVPLDDPTEAPLIALAKQVAGRVPSSSTAQVEKFVRAQLIAMAKSATAVGGQDLLLPTETLQGLRLPMSIVIAVSKPLASARAQSDALLAYAGQHNGAKATETAGSLAVRAIVDVAANPSGEDLSRIFDTRRVSYIVAAPIPTHQMLFVTGSIERYPNDITGEMLAPMEMLFDAMVDTMRFVVPARNAEIGATV
jgi:hypothetical protein